MSRIASSFSHFAKNWKNLTASLGLFVMSFAQAAPSIPAELRENSLVYCTSISGLSFNPQKADVGTNLGVVTEQIYDKLFEFDPHTQRLKPMLAEHYEVNDDGREIVLHLRKNVHFHQTPWFTPSRRLNAEDVVFSLNRMIGRLEELPALAHEVRSDNHFEQLQREAYQNKAAPVHYAYFEKMALKNQIESVSALNSHTVKIRLTVPNNHFLDHLASQYAVILSKEYALQLNADDNLVQLDRLPVGTGVYQLASYPSNDYVRLTPNPNYWGKPAQVANLVVDFSTNGTGRMAKLLNHECDVMAYPEPSQVLSLQQMSEVQTQFAQAEGANLSFLAFNMQSPIMQAVEFRQKIAKAINRPRIAQRLFYGFAEVADNVLPNVMYPTLNLNSYQPTLPAESEQKEEKPTKLRFWVVDESRIFNPHPMKMAEMIRADLQKVGIEVEILPVTRAYIAQHYLAQPAKYDMVLTGWLANNADPNGFLMPILSCQTQNEVMNLTHWCDEEMDEWLKLATLSHEPLAKNMLLRLTQYQLEQQLPILPLVHAHHVVVGNQRVHGLNVSPFGFVRLSELSLADKPVTQSKKDE